MAYDHDTATDHIDLFDRLVAFLQVGITSPGGPDWTLLRYDSAGQRALFLAPGISSTEEIHVGISVHGDAGADAYSLGFWMFRSFNDALGDLEQPGTSAVTYLPLWNAAMPYWFMANGQRVIVAAKVSTVYTAAYAGKFLPYGTPGEYPQPYYVAAPAGTSNTRWSTNIEGVRNFYDPGDFGYILLPSGQWRNVQNYTDSGGEANPIGTNHVAPYQGSSIDSSMKTKYRESRENVDGTYPLWPLILFGSNPDLDIYGEIDGAFAVAGFGNASENIVTVGADDYVVIQNVFRTSIYHYGALKVE